MTGDLVRSAKVGTALTVACLGVAAVVGLACAGAARSWLDFPFTGIPSTAGEALSIFKANMELAAAAIVAALVVQLRWRGENGVVVQVACVSCDVVIGASIAMNLAVVGASLGGYGHRMFAAIMPHAPLELAAYSLVVGFYLSARRQPRSLPAVAGTAATVAVLLAVGAAIETFVG